MTDKRYKDILDFVQAAAHIDEMTAVVQQGVLSYEDSNAAPDSPMGCRLKGDAVRTLALCDMLISALQEHKEPLKAVVAVLNSNQRFTGIGIQMLNNIGVKTG